MAQSASEQQDSYGNSQNRRWAEVLMEEWRDGEESEKKSYGAWQNRARAVEFHVDE